MQRPLSLVSLAAVLFALVGCDSVYQEDSYRQDKHWPTAVVVSGVPASLLFDAEPFRVAATDKDGGALAVTWSSSDPAVASVNSSGQVTVLTAGTTQIVATATQGGKSGAVIVNVQPIVTTLAGSGARGDADGRGASASLGNPRGITMDSKGNLYVADTHNYKIRKITHTGVVTTLAGSAYISDPYGITMDSEGNLYVAAGDDRIRKITRAGVVTTLAGSGYWGSDDGVGTSASFYGPQGITVDSKGTLYVADSGNSKIRKITPTGVVTTFAGSEYSGSDDGIGTSASFYSPLGITVDSEGTLYVADSGNAKIRKITAAGVVTTLAGSGNWGDADGGGTSATFYYPHGITVDSAGNLYVADTYNHKIRRITPAGVVTTLAGTGSSGSDDGPGTSATFDYPKGITVDSNGNLYIADTDNNTIRKIQTKRNP